jgi:hypothetical protein
MCPRGEVTDGNAEGEGLVEYKIDNGQWYLEERRGEERRGEERPLGRLQGAVPQDLTSADGYCLNVSCSEQQVRRL